MPAHGRFARLTTLLVALAALAGLAAMPAAASADDTIGAYGLNDIRSDGILLPHADYQGARDLDLVAGSGAKIYRGRLRMDCADPQRTGSFDFEGKRPGCSGLSYDALIGELARRDLTFLPVLVNFGTAADGAHVPVPPTGANGSPSPEDFGAFARAAATRYGPGGSYWAACGCPPHPIRAWEIWNEENNGWWWGWHASADEYATVFAAARAGLRAADAQARAVVGGLTFDPNGQSFVAPRDMIMRLAAGNANAFDAVAVHPYSDARGRPADAIAAEAQAFVDQTASAIRDATGPAANGAPRQQVWVTELGWADSDTDGGTVAAALQRFAAGLNAGARTADNVGPVLWYMLRDGAYVGSRDDQLGLRRTTSTGQDAGEKPAWGAFAALAQAASGPLPLPPALNDSAGYTPPPPAPVAAPVKPAAAVKKAVVSKRLVLRVRAKAHGAAVRVTVSCATQARTCSGSVSLRAAVARPAAKVGGRKTIGARRLSVSRGASRTYTVKLSKAGRAALRRARRLPVHAVVSAKDSAGRTATASASATLRRG